MEYKLATKSQAIALFDRFYPRHDEEEGKGAGFSLVGPSEMQLEDGTVLHSTPAAELDRLNVEFASHIPDNEFTTAELQGYLLLHRKSPQSAVDNVEKWIENERADKEKRKEAEAARRAKLSPDDDEVITVPQPPSVVAI